MRPAQILGFVHGYLAADFTVTFWWWLAASVVAGVLTVPSWPCLFQRHKVVWADQDGEGEEPASEGCDEDRQAQGGKSATAGAKPAGAKRTPK